MSYASLQAQYDFETLTADSSIFGRNFNTTSGTPTQVAGPNSLGNAVSFGAANSNAAYAYIGPYGITCDTGAITGFTINCWVKFLAQPPTNVGWEIVCLNSSANKGSITIFRYYDESGVKKIRVQRYLLTGAYFDYSKAQTFTTGTWYMVTATSDLTTLRMYVNGAEITGGAYLSNPASLNDIPSNTSVGTAGTYTRGISIAAQKVDAGWGSTWTSMSMDALYIDNVAWSAATISQLYTNLGIRSTSTLNGSSTIQGINTLQF